MKKKLVLIFDKDSEVLGILRSYVFCNEKDAESFLITREEIAAVNVLPNEGYFSFRVTSGWSGSGRCFWAEDKC